MSLLDFAAAALRDLRDIAIYIADDDPDRAVSFVDELYAKAERIAEHPFAYPDRSDLADGIRSAVHGRYVLLYRVLDGRVRIERVLHGSRDVSAMF